MSVPPASPTGMFVASTSCRADRFGVLTGVLDLVPTEFETVAIGPALYESASLLGVRGARLVSLDRSRDVIVSRYTLSRWSALCAVGFSTPCVRITVGDVSAGQALPPPPLPRGAAPISAWLCGIHATCGPRWSFSRPLTSKASWPANERLTF